MSRGDVDRWYIAAFFSLPAVAGSAISVLFGIGVAGILLEMLMRRRFFLTIPRDAIFCSVVFPAYSLLFFASVLIMGDGVEGLKRTAGALPLLFLPKIITQLRADGTSDTLSVAVRFSAVGTILGIVYGLYEYFYYYIGYLRVEGGAGNAVVYAHVMTVLGAFAFCGIGSRRRSDRVLAVVGLVAATAGILMSQTRTFLVVVPVNTAIVLWCMSRQFLAVDWKRVGAAALVVGPVASLLLLPAVHKVVDRSFAEVTATSHSIDSTVVRLKLWKAGWNAFTAAPLTGHGLADKMDAVRSQSEELAGLNYSHLHNAWLDIAVALGVPGVVALLLVLAAPVLAVVRSRDRDPDYGLRLAMILTLTVTSMAAGMTGIMIHHDILATLFAYSVALVLAAGPGPERSIVVAELKAPRRS